MRAKINISGQTKLTVLFSVPYGNYSYIKVLAEDKDLPLYGSGGFRLIWDTKFDAGLV